MGIKDLNFENRRINETLKQMKLEQNEWKREREKYEQNKNKLKKVQNILSQSQSESISANNECENTEILRLRQELKQKCIELDAANSFKQINIEKIKKMEDEKIALFKSTQDKINELQKFINSQKKVMKDNISDNMHRCHTKDIKINELTHKLKEYELKMQQVSKLTEAEIDAINGNNVGVNKNEESVSSNKQKLNKIFDECDTKLIEKEPSILSQINSPILQNQLDAVTNIQKDAIDEEEQYEVKALHGKITEHDGKEWYLAEWRGYNISESIWINEAENEWDGQNLIKEFHDQLIKNNNTICTKHKKYKSKVPCWRHKHCNNNGLQDLRKYGIKYKL